MTERYLRINGMHSDAMNWVYQSFHFLRTKDKYDILEIGSLDINGSVRGIFDSFAASYTGLDVVAGPGVDIVADGATYSLPEAYDVIVTAETFEHTPDWKKIILRSIENLRPGGIFIATMAGEGRPPHSALDEKPIREWEHYSNIGWWELNQTLKSLFTNHEVNILNTDLRCWAVK